MFRKLAILSLISIPCAHATKKNEQSNMSNLHSTAAHTEKGIEKLVSAIPAAADATVKVLKEIPVCVGGTIYAGVAAPFVAAKDGVKYTGQTIAEHPYAFSGTVAGLGVLAASIHYVSENFPSRDEINRRAKLERESAEHKQASASLSTETEFRTCLNTHFRCMDRVKRVPRQCISPARRFSLLNPIKCDQMVDSVNKFND